MPVTQRCSWCKKRKPLAAFATYDVWNKDGPTGKRARYKHCRKCRYQRRKASTGTARSGKGLESVRMELLRYAYDLHGGLLNVNNAHPHLFQQLMRGLQWPTKTGKSGFLPPSQDTSSACGAVTVSVQQIEDLYGYAISASGMDAGCAGTGNR